MPIHPDRILWEDDSFLAVNKLPRELVVKGSGPVQRLPLLDFLKKDRPPLRPLGFARGFGGRAGLRPANRLDFETSGVVLFAKTKAALAAAIAQQKAGGWSKTYRTIVAGHVKADRGEITKTLPARTGKADAHALTRYQVLERLSGVTSLEVTIVTGRHHQIRRHLAMIGHPLVLDHLYGDEKFNRAFSRAYRYHHFFLHASALSFPHPFTGGPVGITAPLPRAFEEVLEKLRT